MSAITTETASPVVARVNAGRAGRLVLGVQVSGELGPSSWVAAQAGTWPDPVLVLHAWTDVRPGPPGAAKVDWFDVDVWPAAVEEPGVSVAAALREKGVSAEVQIRCGSAVEVLLSRLGPDDEVVVGSSGGHAWHRAFGANVVHCLLKRSPCPVVVVPDDWRPAAEPPSRIVVAYDGTAASDVALTWALRHGERVGGTLDLVCVVFSAKATMKHGDALTHLGERAARVAGDHVMPPVRLVELDPNSEGIPEALAHAASGAHALVLGGHAVPWLSEVMEYGTVERTSSVATCPIVVVPVLAHCGSR